jgi:glycosyltransferase involved in cell wall biosynthesis
MNVCKKIKKVALLSIENGISKSKGGPTRVIYNLLKEHQNDTNKMIKLFAVFSKLIVSYYYDNTVEEKVGNNNVSIIRKYLRKNMPIYIFVSCLRLIKNFYKLYRREKNFDVINAHDVISGFLYLIFFKRKIRAPLVLTIHSKGSFTKRELIAQRFVKNLFMFVEKFTVLNSDMIIFPSKGAFEHFSEDITEVRKVLYKVKIINNGIDVNEKNYYDEEGIKWILKKVGQRDIILSVSPLVVEKGVDILIKAFLSLKEEILEKTYLIIIGDGPEYCNLIRLIENYKRDNLLIINKVLPHKDIISLMKKSTIFVLPHRISIFDYVLLEAMLVKLPIITTKVGGNLEIFVENNSVLFVEKEDVEGLANAITYLLENKQEREKIVNIAFNLVVSKFTLKEMYKNYCDVYSKIV